MRKKKTFKKLSSSRPTTNIWFAVFDVWNGLFNNALEIHTKANFWCVYLKLTTIRRKGESLSKNEEKKTMEMPQFFGSKSCTRGVMINFLNNLSRKHFSLYSANFD